MASRPQAEVPHPEPPVPFWVVEEEKRDGGFQYGLLEKRHDVFVLYEFGGRDLVRYARQSGLAPSPDWRITNPGTPGAPLDDEVEVASLSFLEAVLPEMAMGGFHDAVTAYKDLSAGAEDAMATPQLDDAAVIDMLKA